MSKRAIEVSSGCAGPYLVTENYPPQVMEYLGPEGYSPVHGELRRGRMFKPGDLVRGVYDDWLTRGILKPLEVRS